MAHRIVFALAQIACTLAIALPTAMLTEPAVLAQTVAQKKDAPKAKAPQQKGSASQAAEQPGGGAAAIPPLIYSPWTRFCLKDQGSTAKQVCFIGKEGRAESGFPLVAAVLIEPEGEARKLLHVKLPLGVALQPGTRVVIDQGQPMTAPYVTCLQNGCMAEYEASGELIQKMKRGQNLAVHGVTGELRPVTLLLPLSDFAKAYDGPPTDPQMYEAQQRKLQDELQRRAEEARKKLEGQPK